MSKALIPHRSSSAGSSGSDSADVRTGSTLPSNGDDAATPRMTRDWSSKPPLTAADVDRHLKSLLTSKAGSERDALTLLQSINPEMSAAAIWDRMVYLGLTRRTRPPYRKHEWTEEDDLILRAEYGSSRKASKKAIDHILALHPDWSRDAVVWRARALGLSQRRDSTAQPWSEELDHRLLGLVGQPLNAISQRLGRSRQAVRARLRHLGKSAEFFGGYKTKDLVRDLRVDELTVNFWVRRGWINRRNGRITEASLERLCRHHPAQIPFETIHPDVQRWLTMSLGYGKRNGRVGG